VIHVGDGACAVRLNNARSWLVPSWPAQGEYASTTYFVTDDPKPRTISAVFPTNRQVLPKVRIFIDALKQALSERA
jgi:hypothetical protein